MYIICTHACTIYINHWVFLNFDFMGFFRFPSFCTELVLFYMIWIYHFPQSMIILPSLTNWCAFRKYHWWVVVVKKKTALIICKKFIWYYFKEIVIHAALNRSDEYSALPHAMLRIIYYMLYSNILFTVEPLQHGPQLSIGFNFLLETIFRPM